MQSPRKENTRGVVLNAAEKKQREKADDEWAERLRLKIEESSQKDMKRWLDDFFNRFYMIYGLFTIVITGVFFVLKYIVG